ncbi:MAG: dockerin type I domain-containing protein [Phycisphaerales bacterium]|nr:dockerin type I domain-containing protein [Phycisphaerales bacterium]
MFLHNDRLSCWLIATGLFALTACGCRPHTEGPDQVESGKSFEKTGPEESGLTDDQVTESLGLSLAQVDRLHREGHFTNADLVRMPRKTLMKALHKLDNPKPQHPGEAALFRYNQRLNEDDQIPDNALMLAKQHRDVMIEAQEQAAFARDAGLEPGPGAWRWLGPGNTGGRIRTLLIHPSQPNIMWAGAVSGGVWKSLNSGQSWFPLDDFMANLAVTTLVMDPSNPNTIYAGTGEGVFGIISNDEGNNNAAALRGAGVFVTTDGGSTWTQLASTANANWYYVNRLAISPVNGQILLAATNSGIWRTTDGGTTWTQRTTTPTYDVDFDAPNVPGPATVAVAGRNGSALYSTDGGVSWSVAGFVGIGGGAGRVELAISQNTPSPNNGRVYASVDINNGEIWLSTNGGVTYSQIYTGTENYLGGQGWYNNTIWVQPASHPFFDTLIVGGVDLWRATGAATYTLTRISDWTLVPNPGTSAHADHHVIAAHPAFNGTTNRMAFFGNDGGVYQVNDVATVTTNSGWTDLNNRLGVSQFYGAAAHPTSGTVIGGTQDVGTVTFNGSTDTWSEMFGGDGGFCASDPTNANVYFSEYVFGRIVRSTDGGASASYIHNPRGVVSGDGDLNCVGCFEGSNAISDALSANSNFIAPFALDPNNTNTMIVAAADLWRSTDVQSAQPNWFSIRSTLASFHSAIAIAQGNSNIIWVGHSNVGANGGDVYMTTNGTAATPTWTRVDNMSPNLPNRWVSSIAIDPSDTNRVYVTFMGYNSDNVWRTTDGGSTWTQITGSGPTALPSAPVSSIALHPTNAGWLYVGTDVGVFASIDDGASWSTSNDGPANVTVDQLFFKDSRTLVAATHGRGIYQFTPPQLSIAGLDSGGQQFGFGSFAPSVSAYGRYVSFFDLFQVYVRDRQNNTTTMVSVESGGTPGNGTSSASAISANGQIVAFFSIASNLVPNDNNGAADIFVRDLQAGTTTRVSVASDGTEANAGVDSAPAISPNGRYVAFCSSSNNLIGAGNDNNGTQDVFVHDRKTGTTTRVSVSSSGTEGNGGSCDGSFSGDGRYVAFSSNASNLVAGDTSGDFDCFVHDRQTGTTTRVSVTSSGAEVSGFNVRPKLSSDGRFVLFETNADFLSGGDTMGFLDVYAHDRDTDVDGIFDEPGQISTTRITVASDGTQGDGSSGMFGWFAMSSDSRYVTFASDATNLVADDTNNRTDVFLIDRDVDRDGTFDEPGAISTTRVSVDANGLQGNFGNFPVQFGESNSPAMSCNGGLIAFRSTSWSLIAPDNNVEKADVFVFDRLFGNGDVNLDGSVDGQDQQAFLNVLLGNDTTVAKIAEADLNRDGKVDLADSSILTNRLLGNCP